MADETVKPEASEIEIPEDTPWYGKVLLYPLKGVLSYLQSRSQSQVCLEIGSMAFLATTGILYAQTATYTGHLNPVNIWNTAIEMAEQDKLKQSREQAHHQKIYHAQKMKYEATLRKLQFEADTNNDGITDLGEKVNAWTKMGIEPDIKFQKPTLPQIDNALRRYANSR